MPGVCPPRTAAKPPQSGTENGDATPMSATWRPGSARGTRPLGLKPGDAGGSGDGIDPRRPPPAGASASTGAHGTSPQAATRPRTGAARAARYTNERTPPPDTRSCREPARTPHHPHPRHCTSVTFAASGGARNTTAPQTDSRQAPCGIRGLRSTCRENRAFYARRYTPRGSRGRQTDMSRKLPKTRASTARERSGAPPGDDVAKTARFTRGCYTFASFATFGANVAKARGFTRGCCRFAISRLAGVPAATPPPSHIETP